jgi:hypothetical protein
MDAIIKAYTRNPDPLGNNNRPDPGYLVGANPATWSPTPMQGADQLGHAADENAIPIIDTVD